MYEAEAKQPQLGLAAARRSIPDELERQKERLQGELNDVNRAIELFDENPKLAEALQLVRRFA